MYLLTHLCNIKHVMCTCDISTFLQRKCLPMLVTFRNNVAIQYLTKSLVDYFQKEGNHEFDTLKILATYLCQKDLELDF